MANTDRRILNEDKTKQFIPMNMTGQDDDDPFISNTKLAAIIGIIVIYIFTFVKMSGHSALAKVCMFIIATFISQLILRYIVFDEKFYYKMYKETRNKDVVSTEEFWNIPNVKKVDNGAVLIYGDTRVGVIVKLNRDVITGKEKGFSEIHYDALSNVIKNLISCKYSIVQMNLMEPNDKDNRFDKMDRLKSCDNPNINKVNTLLINNIKNVASNTLNDNDYYLIYGNGIVKYEDFISNIEEILEELTNGGYTGYDVLGYNEMKDINEFAKLNFNVEYFNFNDAELSMFNNARNGIVNNSVKIKGIIWSSGEYREISNNEERVLMKEASEVIDKDNYSMKKSVKDTLMKGENKNSFSVDLDEIRELAER